jgi:hypothetical protein
MILRRLSQKAQDRYVGSLSRILVQLLSIHLLLILQLELSQEMAEKMKAEMMVCVA